MNDKISNEGTGRRLPEYSIGNTVFLVDVANQELREKAHPKNRLSFHDMEYKGSFYSLWYEEKNTPGAEYHVPNMVELDREGMAQKYNLPLKALEGKTDFDVIVDQDFYNERKNGKQPTIQIGKHQYYVDYHWGMLKPHIDHTKPVKRWPEDLAFDNLESVDGDKAYQFFFDTKKQAIFEFDGDILSIPPDIFLVTIPAEETLDPYGYARKWGENMEQYLMLNPPQRNFIASMVPAEQTFLKDMVKENREKFNKDDLDKGNNQQQKKKM